MKWKIEKNVISSLEINNEEIINPWGVETSDTSAFYSLEKGIGYRFEVLEESEESSESEHCYSAKVQMKDGAFRVNLKERLVGNTLSRTVELEVLEELPLMDFVLRFRFKDHFFKKAFISGNEFVADNSNIYHQFEANEAKLIGEKYEVRVSAKECIKPDSFTQCMYVRNRAGEWIIHARMIPNRSDRNVIKLCSKWFMTRPLPKFLSDLALKSEWIRNATWYRGERNPFSSRVVNIFNPNSFAMINLPKGEKLKWSVECEINER
jgi:hypothetical protein